MINILIFTYFMCGMLILCFQKGFDTLRDIVPALENCSSKESKSSMLFKCRYTIFVNKYFFNLRYFVIVYCFGIDCVSLLINLGLCFVNEYQFLWSFNNLFILSKEHIFDIYMFLMIFVSFN